MCTLLDGVLVNQAHPLFSLPVRARPRRYHWRAGVPIDDTTTRWVEVHWGRRGPLLPRPGSHAQAVRGGRQVKASLRTTRH